MDSSVRTVPPGTKDRARADDLKGSDAVDLHETLRQISAELWELNDDLAGFEHTGVGKLARRLCADLQKLVGVVDLLIEERAR
jgi:hypothetical protein